MKKIVAAIVMLAMPAQAYDFADFRRDYCGISGMILREIIGMRDRGAPDYILETMIEEALGMDEDDARFIAGMLMSGVEGDEEMMSSFVDGCMGR